MDSGIDDMLANIVMQAVTSKQDTLSSMQIKCLTTFARIKPEHPASKQIAFVAKNLGSPYLGDKAQRGLIKKACDTMRKNQSTYGAGKFTSIHKHKNPSTRVEEAGREVDNTQGYGNN